MATETTLTAAGAWHPDLTSVAPADAVPEALILQTSTISGSVEGDNVAVRVQYVDDDTAGFVDEGAAIDEADPDLAETLVYTGKISQLIRLSREQMTRPNANDLLSQSVRRAVTKAADVAYISQVAPTPPDVSPPAGLLNISGIETGDPVADDLDSLVDLIALLESNGATPSHILASPLAWAALRKIKTGTGSAASLLGAGTADATRMLLNLPVIVNRGLSGHNGMVVDRAAIVSAVGDVQVATSKDVYFSSDSIGLRCTWRIGWNVVHANRLGAFTVTDES